MSKRIIEELIREEYMIEAEVKLCNMKNTLLVIKGFNDERGPHMPKNAYNP